MPSGDDFLCCYEFQWQQLPSWFRRASTYWVDPGLKWLQNIFQPEWKPYSWSLAEHLKPLASGFVFSSNVAAGAYFRQFYGLDRATWLKARTGSGPLSKTNAASQVVVTLNTQNLQALQAFGDYCLSQLSNPGD
jgi:hypothetical protein